MAYSLEKCFERVFYRCNEIGDDVDIDAIMGEYKAVRELTEAEYDAFYDGIARRLGFLKDDPKSNKSVADIGDENKRKENIEMTTTNTTNTPAARNPFAPLAAMPTPEAIAAAMTDAINEFAKTEAARLTDEVIEKLRNEWLSKQAEAKRLEAEHEAATKRVDNAIIAAAPVRYLDDDDEPADPFADDDPDPAAIFTAAEAAAIDTNSEAFKRAKAAHESADAAKEKYDEAVEARENIRNNLARMLGAKDVFSIARLKTVAEAEADAAEAKLARMTYDARHNAESREAIARDAADATARAETIERFLTRRNSSFSFGYRAGRWYADGDVCGVDELPRDVREKFAETVARLFDENMVRPESRHSFNYSRLRDDLIGLKAEAEADLADVRSKRLEAEARATARAERKKNEYFVLVGCPYATPAEHGISTTPAPAAALTAIIADVTNSILDDTTAAAEQIAEHNRSVNSLVDKRYRERDEKILAARKVAASRSRELRKRLDTIAAALTPVVMVARRHEAALAAANKKVFEAAVNTAKTTVAAPAALAARKVAEAAAAKHKATPIVDMDKAIADARADAAVARKVADEAAAAAPKVVFTMGMKVNPDRPTAALAIAHRITAAALTRLFGKADVIAERRCVYNPAAAYDTVNGFEPNESIALAAPRAVAKKTAANAVKRQGSPTQWAIYYDAISGRWFANDLADLVSEAAEGFALYGLNEDRIKAEHETATRLAAAADRLNEIAIGDKIARAAFLNRAEIVVAAGDPLKRSQAAALTYTERRMARDTTPAENKRLADIVTEIRGKVADVRIVDNPNAMRARANATLLVTEAALAKFAATNINSEAALAEAITRAMYRLVNNYLGDSRAIRDDAKSPNLDVDSLAEILADPRIYGEDVSSEYKSRRREIMRAAIDEATKAMTATQLAVMKAIYKSGGNIKAAARKLRRNESTIREHLVAISKLFAAALAKVAPESIERELVDIAAIVNAYDAKSDAAAAALTTAENKRAKAIANNAAEAEIKAATADVNLAAAIADAIKVAVAEMPDKMRDATMLIAKGKSKREAAKILGKNESTIRESIKAACRKIAAAIAAAAPACEAEANQLAEAADVNKLLALAIAR